MMTVCLVVLSIVGSFCYADAAPIGDCQFVAAPVNMALCVVDAQELPLRASWYDPFIETDSPAIAAVQCQEPCHLLGDGTAVSDAYGWALSCPVGWYGRWLEIEYAGRWQCRDHGGAIKPQWGYAFTGTEFVWGWWITVDFLLPEQPLYAYMLLDWQGVDDTAVSKSGKENGRALRMGND